MLQALRRGPRLAEERGARRRHAPAVNPGHNRQVHAKVLARAAVEEHRVIVGVVRGRVVLRRGRLVVTAADRRQLQPPPLAPEAAADAGQDGAEQAAKKVLGRALPVLSKVDLAAELEEEGGLPEAEPEADARGRRPDREGLGLQPWLCV